MIHYITLWGENNINRKLSYSPAGLKKAKYIVEVLSRIDHTKIISFASGGKKWNGLYKKTNINWKNNIDIEYCFTFGSSNKVCRLIERILNIIQMMVYFIKVPQNDIIVIYHERYFRHAIKFLKFFKKTKIILEIEEVYTLAGNYPKKMINNELDSFRYADAYILVNDLLRSILNLESNKPYCISYGPYQIYKVNQESSVKDGKIHVVYAGVIDRIKKGAEMAIKSGRYLPENYCLHIAGFGLKSDIEYIKTLIETENKESKCEIRYEGYLEGLSYDNLISNCTIGLSTQVSGEYNFSETSFPSKIINYLSYGLTVVSTKIKVLESCELSNLLSFYSSDNPQLIAEAIINCPIVEKSTAQEKIKTLDKNFESNLKNIIVCLNHSYKR